jgi:asparagine N-glycosylation enzyme membrane subunit Stt3
MSVENNNNRSNVIFGVLIIVLGAILMLNQFAPIGEWFDSIPIWRSVFNFFDSSFSWHILFCVLGILWLVRSVSEKHYVQMIFALILSLSSFSSLLQLDWNYWAFIPALSLMLMGGIILYRR